MNSGTTRAGRENTLAVDDDDALRHQSGAQRHHQRLHAQQRDADAVDQPDDQAEREPDRRPTDASPNRNVIVVIRNAEPVATLTTERSMPPVSITSVCPAARMPSGAANSSVLDSQTELTVPGLHDLDAGDEHEQQQDQHDDRVALQPAADSARANARQRRSPLAAHLRVLAQRRRSRRP